MSRFNSLPAPYFQNRQEAGQQLAQALSHYGGQPHTWVVALPRGGVPVAAEIAAGLQLPLEICLVRKLGVPGQPELAMGAIAAHGVQILNQDVIERMEVSPSAIERVAAAETEELQRRDRTYRGNRPPLTVADQTVILVDDGIATGSTLRAAIAILKRQEPQRLVIAVPVASPQAVEALQEEVDEVVCLVQPNPLYSISLWYHNFDQTSDETVCRLLNETR